MNHLKILVHEGLMLIPKYMLKLLKPWNLCIMLKNPPILNIREDSLVSRVRSKRLDKTRTPYEHVDTHPQVAPINELCANELNEHVIHYMSSPTNILMM